MGGSRGVASIAGFGFRTHPRAWARIGRCARNVGNPAETRRDRPRRPQNQANRIGGQSVGICMESRAVRPVGGFASGRIRGEESGLRARAPEMYEIRRRRGAIGAEGRRINRPEPASSRLGPSWNCSMRHRTSAPPPSRRCGRRREAQDFRERCVTLGTRRGCKHEKYVVQVDVCLGPPPTLLPTHIINPVKSEIQKSRLP